MKYSQLLKKLGIVIIVSIVTHLIMIILFPIFIPISQWLFSVMGKQYSFSIYIILFVLDFERVISCFLGGIIVGVLIKNRGWFYGLFVAVGAFIIFGLVATQIGGTFVELMQKYADKGMLFGRVVQGILIFLLSAGGGMLGGHIGEKIVKKCK